MLQLQSNMIQQSRPLYSLLASFLSLILFWTSLTVQQIHAQVDGFQIQPIAAWNVDFAGSKATYRFAVQGKGPQPPKANWSLMAENRTLARGETAIPAKAEKLELAIPLKFPDVRDGIRYPVQLAIELDAAGKKISYEHQIILFPEDPFHERMRWLESLNLVLYDPVGKTADIFDQAKIPYKFLRSTAAIDEDAGVIVIGEGISLETDRGLANVLLQKASEGAKILLLAPSDGQIPIPGSTESKLPRPTRISLRGPDVIADLDKQLVGNWAPGGKPQLATFQFQTDRDLAIWKIHPPGKGWTWIDLEYGKSGGQLILCGLGLIDRWEAGPAPRYFLSALLAKLSSEKKSAENPR